MCVVRFLVGSVFGAVEDCVLVVDAGFVCEDDDELVPFLWW